MPPRTCPDETFCRADLNNPRHQHRLHMLNGIGELCWSCKANDWRLWYGGALPALIRCGLCGRGFNLSERLRATTNPAARDGI